MTLTRWWIARRNRTRLGTDVVTLNRALFEKVLAEHDWRWVVRESRTGEDVRIACTAVGCEWFADRDDTEDVWTAQRSHVAAALDAAIGSPRTDHTPDEIDELSEWYDTNSTVAAQEGERGGAEVSAEYASNYDFRPHADRASAEAVRARFGGFIYVRQRTSFPDVVTEWQRADRIESQS